MLILKGFRYRVYPTPEQEIFLAQVSGCVRLVYNTALAQIEMFGRRGRSFCYEGQRAELSALKAEADFLKHVPHHCLQEGLIDLHKAMKNFFEKRAGFPSPRRKRVDDGIRFPDPKQIRFSPVFGEKFALLRLPKLGMRKGDHGAIRLRYHWPIAGEIRSVSMNHSAGQWYVSILCRVNVADPATPHGEPVGVDRGVAVPLFCSNGKTPYVPRVSARQRERVKRLQQRIARSKRGSNNRRRAVQLLGRCKAAEGRARRDAVHKATTYLAKNHCLVGIENLRVKSMTASAAGTTEEPGRNVRQKAGLNRSILESGWGMANQMLKYKTDWYGSELVAVPPMHSSQECSECGYTDAENRPTRDVFRCLACGHAEHADSNASKVVRKRAIAIAQENGFVIPYQYVPTPEDTYSGSACGALCTAQTKRDGTAMKQELSAVRLGSPVVYGGE